MAEHHQSDGITSLLGIEGYWVRGLRGEGDGFVVEIEGSGGKMSCPRCSGHRLYRHGKAKPRKVLHGWMRGKRVYLLLARRRWRCQGCGHSFTEGASLVRPYSRMSRQAESEALYELREHSFSQVGRRLGVSYSTLRRLLERDVNYEVLNLMAGEGSLSLGIDEHSFRHQEMVFTVTEVKQRRMLGILKDDRISSLKAFLSRLSAEKVGEVCIDMREGLWKATEAVFPQARVVVDHFHVVADANKRMDEARRLEQEAAGNKARIPKRVFLVGREKLREEQRQRVDSLLRHYPNIKAFYWAKEALRELYRQEDKTIAARQLDNIILNLKAGDDGELIRWGNTLKRWQVPILNHFDNRTTNGFTEGCNTKIKMLKRISYGLRNVEVYWRKMLLGFLPAPICFHTN